MGREEGPRGIERVGKGREGVDRADRKMMGGRDNGNGKGKGEKGKRGGKGRDMDCIVQCFTSPPTQYRLYGRRFLQVKRPNQQYQSTEGRSTTQNENNTKNVIHTEIRNSTR